MTLQIADLTIDEILADPMIMALRRADRVEPQAFERLLRAKALALRCRAVANRSAGLTGWSAGAAADASQAGHTPAEGHRPDRAGKPPQLPAYLCRRMLDGCRNAGLHRW